jgi:hypothetical protein
MSKVKQYIEQATNERIRSRGLIRTERRNEAASYRSV